MLVKFAIGRIKQGRHLFATDSLFRNATYLTGSTLVMSVLGFFFWIFIAHLYSPTEIGVASALIAVTTLISNISLLGLNLSMVRFLPSGKNQSRDINAVTIVVGSVTLFAAAIYAFIGTHVSGHIGLLASTDSKIAFTVLMVAVSLNSLTDSVFIAQRRGEYHTAGYAMLGLTKLILPLALVSFGAAGIFSAYILAMIASLVLSYYLMWRGCGYHFFARPNWKVISKMRTYAAHNYVGVVLNGLPAQLLPILIIKDIGASSVAFFSMAWTMANLLYVVPAAAMQSLLAEVSNDPEKQTEHIKRMVRLLVILLVPMVAIAVIVAPFMLRIFGPQYQHHATEIFQLFALSTFFVAISSVGNTLLNIAHKTTGVVITQVVNVVVTFSSAFWLVHDGLRGIGISIVLGNLAASVMYLILLRDLGRRKAAGKTGIVRPVPLEVTK
jgi:O-antigen/teichoic acid export membrane protein